MANPVFIDCTEGEYTKVATGIITGFFWRIKADAEYFYTYRITEDPAPTLFDDSVRIFKDDDESDNVVELVFNELVDVYIWSVGGAGRLRVDV